MRKPLIARVRAYVGELLPQAESVEAYEQQITDAIDRLTPSALLQLVSDVLERD